METVKTVVTFAAFGIAGAVVVLNGIAPLTKSTKDDKLRDFFVFVHDKILMAILPFLVAQKATATKEVK